MTAFIFYFLFHILLGQAMRVSPIVATVHAYLTLAVGLIVAISGRRAERVAYIGAYIVGSEVLWRMTHAHIFWEYGKYAVSLIFIVSTFLRGAKKPALPVFYFLLLLPSIFVNVSGYDNSGHMRDQISFNLSGPLLLTISVLFFSKLRMNRNQLYRLFLTLNGPVLAIATIVRSQSQSAKFLEDAVIRRLPGLVGPNQVSAILGLGALAIFFFLIDSHSKKILRYFMYGVGLLIAGQCALTFSRGGLYMAAAGIIAIVFFMIQNKKARFRLISVIILLIIGAMYVVVPRLSQLTQGKVSTRFHETSFTGRDSIFKDDLQIWWQHSLFGVGPGLAMRYRTSLEFEVAAHTEFSRSLAEHGIFGLFSLVMFVVMGSGFIRKARDSRAKALAASMVIWTSFHFLAYATRIAAPSFTFGLAAMTLLPDVIMPHRPQAKPAAINPLIELPKREA